MKPLVKRVLVPVALCVLVGSARAEINEYKEGKKKTADATATSSVTAEKVAWRNSTFAYENSVSALSFNRGADLTYNPYYAQSLSFRPRYYLRDDLSLRARLDLEIELTLSDDSDHAREWILSDLLLDVNYAPSWMTIPVLKVQVNPYLRFAFPTSKVSQGHSMMLSMGPGFALRREFPLLKGRFLKSIGLTYAFRGTKYLNEFTTGQIATGICLGSNPDNPACTQSGTRNVSWRLNNVFEARLQIMDKLSFTADVLLFNDLLYKLDSEDVSAAVGSNSMVGDSRINHRAATWVIFDVSYDLLEWLWLSLGTSTFYSQLTPDSNYRTPLFNRYTTFYLDVTLPVDRFVNQVRSWARR